MEFFNVGGDKFKLTMIKAIQYCWENVKEGSGKS